MTDNPETITVVEKVKENKKSLLTAQVLLSLKIGALCRAETTDTRP